MYIDSPNFPRRKVVGGDHLTNLSGMGSDRAKLANFVAEQLESHNNDAAILEKFRKQAQQYKRNLLRRKHTHIEQNLPSPSNFIRHPASQKILTPMPYIEPEKLPTEQSQINPQVRRIEISTPNKANNPSVIILQQDRQKRSLYEQQQILSQIKKRDHKIKKQGEQLKKNEQKMRRLALRLQRLQNEERNRQNERIHRMEEESYGRIKNLMGSMSNQLIENQSYIQKSLLDLNRKVSHHGFSHSVSKVTNAPRPTRKQPNIVGRKNQVEWEKPIISYNYSVVRDKDMEEKSGIQSMINNLQTNRNRLDILNERRVPSFRSNY